MSRTLKCKCGRNTASRHPYTNEPLCFQCFSVYKTHLKRKVKWRKDDSAQNFVSDLEIITNSPEVDAAIKFTMRQKDAPFTDRLNFVLSAIDGF